MKKMFMAGTRTMLASAALALAAGETGGIAIAGSSILPGEPGRGAGGTNVPGVPNVDLTLKNDGTGSTNITIEGDLVPIGPLQVTVDDPANGRIPLPLVNESATAVADEAQTDQHGVQHTRPAAPLPEDLGGQQVVGQRHQAKTDGGNGGLGATTSGDPAALTTDGEPTTVLGTVQHLVGEVTDVAEAAVDDVLRHTYEAHLRGGEDSLAVVPGAARDDALRAAPQLQAEAYLDGLGFDGRREKFPFLPDAFARNVADLARTVGPAVAANMAEEAAAREESARLDKLIKLHYAILKGRAAEGETLTAEDQDRVTRTMANWGEHADAVNKAKAAVAQVGPDDAEAKLAPWRDLWTDAGFRGTARKVLADGRYYTPLKHRRLLLGLDLSDALTRQRLSELAGDFVQDLLEGTGLSWAGQQRAVVAYSALKSELKKAKGGLAPAGSAAVKAEYQRFAEFTGAMEEFSPYIREAVDLILLSAPDERDLPSYATNVLRRTGKILAPLLRGGEEGRLAMLDEESRRQFFFETLQKVLFPRYRLEFRIGLGGSNDAPSVRMFSYVIPALNQMRAFLANGAQPPTLIIFNGQALSQTVNALDSASSLGNAELANESLRAFIRRFYPDLAGHVRVEMRTLEELRRHPFEDNVAHLRALQANEAASQDAKTKVLLGDLDKMRERAIKHGGLADDDAAKESAIRYVAAHPGPDAFGDIQMAEGLDRSANLPPHAVVEWGGSGETRFKRLQVYLANLHPTAAGSRTYLPNTAFGVGAAGSPARARAIFAEMAVGTNPPYYRPGGKASEITLAGLRAQLRAHGIRTAEGLLRYYETSFEDRTISFDVGVLVRSVDSGELMRFLMEFDPGR